MPHPTPGALGPQTSGRRILATLAAAAVFVVALVAAPGAGAIGFQSAGSITDPAMTFPRAVAVDPSSGNVYVAQFTGAVFPEPGSVLRFDASGVPLTSASMGTGYYVGVAVEQGGDHTVYGFDNELNGSKGTPHIDAFDSSGSELGAPFPLEVGMSGSQIGSDSEGNIYFPDWITNTVKKYTSAAVAGTPTEFECTGTDCDSVPLETATSVAVDTSGNVYVADGLSNSRVVKFKADGSFDSVFYEGDSRSVAVDTASGMVLVAGNDGELGWHVTALDSSGNVIGEIPTSAFAADTFSMQLAINPTTGTLYAAILAAAEKKIAIFDILPTPTAATGLASDVVATSATLNGTVNPNGVISDDCQFEYTDDADFQANGWANAESAPCDPQPFNESTDVAVSADVTGLAPGTTYDFRVVETTGGGTANGDPAQLTTLTLPIATTGAASGITQHTATLSATVNPSGKATTNCRIEWGPSAGNYSSGQAPCSPSPGSGSSDIAVSAAASGLAANTTYHYRVVETTTAGTANGADKSFVTLADTCATNSALCPPNNGGGGTGGGGGGTGGGGSSDDKAAYGKCVAAVNKAYAKALKAAKSKHGKARAKAIKAAKKKKAKSSKSCKSRFL